MEKRDTEKDFITAFWNLYEVKPIEKISISLLCKTAGYNRATFYNHFENIYDLLNKAISSIVSPIKSNVFSEKKFYILLREDHIGAILFAYFQQQNKYIELLFKRENYYLLSQLIKKEILLQISKEAKDNTSNIEVLVEYQISAVLGVINYWYQQGKTISEETLLQIIYDISSKGVLNYLKAELNDFKE